MCFVVFKNAFTELWKRNMQLRHHFRHQICTLVNTKGLKYKGDTSKEKEQCIRTNYDKYTASIVRDYYSIWRVTLTIFKTKGSLQLKNFS